MMWGKIKWDVYVPLKARRV